MVTYVCMMAGKQTTESTYNRGIRVCAMEDDLKVSLLVENPDHTSVEMGTVEEGGALRGLQQPAWFTPRRLIVVPIEEASVF